MKRYLYTLVAPLMLLLIAACGPSKQEKMLDGKWFGSDDEASLASLQARQFMEMKFDAESRDVRISISFIDPKYNQPLASVELKGDYRLSDDHILIDFDSSDANVNQTNIEALARLAGSDPATVLKQAEHKIADIKDACAKMKIKDLDSDQLELDIDSEDIDFTKGSRPDIPAPQTIPSPADKATPVAAEAKAAPIQDHSTLYGAIGRYPIEMELNLGASSADGRYRYTKSGSGGWLVLTGSRSGNSVRLYEFNDKGEQTGEFSGVISGSTFSGSFINFKGKTYSFSLSPR